MCLMFFIPQHNLNLNTSCVMTLDGFIDHLLTLTLANPSDLASHFHKVEETDLKKNPNQSRVGWDILTCSGSYISNN